MALHTDYFNEMAGKYKDIAISEPLKEVPKISVIVPCYNAEKYLEKCLDSIIKQTYKNFEVICVDDGSKDSTADIISGFTHVDRRFRMIKQNNSGVSFARNVGLKNAIGEYVVFIDSDDWIDENYFELLLNAIEKHDCDIAVATIIRKRKFIQKYRVYYKQEEVYSSLKDKIKVCDIPKCCYNCGKLYKRDLIKNDFYKEGVFFEDVLWIPEIIKKSNRLVTVPTVNYYYRVHSDSIVKKMRSNKKQDDLYQAKKYIIKFFEENNLFLPDKEWYITKRIIYIFAMPILKIKEYKNRLTYLLFGFLPIFNKQIGGLE